MTPADMLPLLPQRLTNKFTIDASGCWLWSAAKQQNGYGVFKWDGLGQPAHRVVYSLICGRIADGMELDHSCEVKSCVNPDHLRPVTRTENAQLAGASRRRRRSA